ncbi:dipeptide ABC transporter ATP-binding protein [Microbacterium sp. No. 7]|uniref:dipeptide ABC transporter ATP-binding protein n=1 Tax=Microbacterium sp. No. 7 TaxID=1714373 RepID=UPI0006ED3BAA|nr:ABC transporter ATP-binding protein [Microbacterium sp. No. 7]ALJ22111.1 ABC transporter ATP-binding protein [Microbacterium sp. No. 7]
MSAPHPGILPSSAPPPSASRAEAIRADAILTVRGLSVSFDGGRSTVVRGLDVEIGAGECVALVGESGSGKSVSARALLGVAGRGALVTADRLAYRDRDLTRLTEAGFRQVRGVGIGLVLQDALGSLDPLRRVGAEVGEALAVHRIGSRQQRPGHVRRLLADVGVPEPGVRAAQYPHELSGGLRQRALIASALAGAPEIIIADEPTTALDVTVQARILDLLGELKAQGTGLLLISHDLAVVGRLADRVVVLRRGEVVESGPALDVLTAPTQPYVRELIRSVPSAESKGRSLVTGEPLPEPAPIDEDRPPVVAVTGVTKRYRAGRRGEITAVADVSFRLAAGEVLGIVGESGSGKSTLGRIVLGHVVPDAGRVLVHGTTWREARGSALRSLRRRIQTVSQDPLGSFDPRYSVARIVGEALPGLSRPQRRARVQELLESVGLGAEHLDRKPVTLSGGQRQRVAIARALATRPDVLVCDEAVSALDVTVQAQVLDLLEHLRATTGVAIVFISHDLGVVHHIADRVLVMKDGHVVESGDVREVFAHPRHDYTTSLLAAIPTLPAPIERT